LLFFTKLVATLLLPPSLFIFLFASLIFFLFFLKPKKSKRLRPYFLGLLILIYLSSIGLISGKLLYWLESPFYPPRHGKITIQQNWQSAQVVVVLGGGVDHFSPETFGESATLSPVTLKRLLVGWKIAKEKSLPILLSGGIVFQQAGYTAEAEVMKRTLIDWGVNESSILVEDQSRTTEENAKFSAPLLISKNLTNVILVSSAWHLKRAARLFSSYPLQLQFFPSDCRSGYPNQKWSFPSFTSFVPSMNALASTELALHEYLGILFLMMRGK
jgi:uncharacterized SAM-binding protein YcdF (DUF218 family)